LSKIVEFLSSLFGTDKKAVPVVEPGKIVVTDSVSLEHWKAGSSHTVIEGGKIDAPSITASKIPAGSTLEIRIPDTTVTIKTGLQQEAAFYDVIRKEKLFGPKLDTPEFKGIQEILKDCAKAKWPIAWVAYALATAYHETARTMKPIKEYGGNGYFTKMYDIKGSRPSLARQMGNTAPGDGAKYCGRGFVQLTWKVNYKKASEKLKVDLVNNPDLAMSPDIASDIMILGMSEGWFTGKKCSTYLPTKTVAKFDQFKQARRIINGLDKADMIAKYAISFQTALQAGQWSI